MKTKKLVGNKIHSYPSLLGNSVRYSSFFTSKVKLIDQSFFVCPRIMTEFMCTLCPFMTYPRTVPTHRLCYMYIISNLQPRDQLNLAGVLLLLWLV